MSRSVAAVILGAFLVSCSDPELAKRVDDLEAKVKELESRGPSAGAAAAGAPSASPEQEQAAQALLKEATQAIDAMDYEGAKAKVETLKKDFADTRAAKAVARIDQELQVIGKPATDFVAEKWYQGSPADVNGKATMYVFWEVWCPHCRREVPKLSETYGKYKGQGLAVVGVTRQTKDVTDQQVTDFIAENKVSYPIAKDQGDTVSNYYGVRGIPAAAVVKDGKVVWRGHPAKVTDAMINAWLGS